jgi:hypothetical protein
MRKAIIKEVLLANGWMDCARRLAKRFAKKKFPIKLLPVEAHK